MTKDLSQADWLNQSALCNGTSISQRKVKWWVIADGINQLVSKQSVSKMGSSSVSMTKTVVNHVQ